ncbi:MAG: LEA type 2 family protein [Gemmatimonadota bacterium]
MTTKTRLMLGAVLMVAACSSAVKQPEVVLSSIDIAGIGLRGATLIANLEVANPNDFEIETDSISFELEAANPTEADSWSRVSRGTVTERITVDDHDRTIVQIPVEFAYSSLSGALRSIMDRGTFNYRIRGTAYLREPLRRAIPFTKSGNLSLAGAN